MRLEVADVIALFDRGLVSEDEVRVLLGLDAAEVEDADVVVLPAVRLP